MQIERQPGYLFKEAVRAALMVPRRATAASRALPDWLIIGTQKGGTTSLYAELCQHPAVGPAFRKEPHFFDERWHRGVAWYRANFPRRAASQSTGEASPIYLFDPQVPARVQQVVPDVRLIVMLRDPVDRAWSHYHHERRRGHEHLTFEEAIDAEPVRLAEPGSQGDYHHRHHSYLARGRYAEQLERWLRLFPMERLHIIRSEDYYADPDTTYSEVLRFLGLPFHQLAQRKKLNVGRYRDRMSPAMRGRLNAYFKPHNEALYTLLNRDMQWGERSPATRH